MAKGNRSIGAWDLMQQLQADPEWVAQHNAREAKRAEAEARFRIEEEPIIADLAVAGFEVGSVWDLVNTNDRYPSAIPVLLKHLDKPYHVRIREGVIRALTTPDARGLAAEAVLANLSRESDGEIRWALANALTVVADRTNVGAIQALLDDPTYADVNERLGEALKTAGSAQR